MEGAGALRGRRRWGWSPTSSGVIKTLVSAGREPRCETCRGVTALDYCCEQLKESGEEG